MTGGFVFDRLHPFGPFYGPPPGDPLADQTPTPLDPARLAAAQTVLNNGGDGGWFEYYNGLRGYFWTQSGAAPVVDCGENEARAMLVDLRPDLAEYWMRGRPGLLLSSMVDPFTGSSLVARWGASYGDVTLDTGSGGRVTVQTTTAYPALALYGQYQFDSVSVKIAPATQPGNGSIETTFEIVKAPDYPGSPTDKMQIYLGSGGLQFVLVHGTRQYTTVAYDAIAMAYWRMRNDGVNMYWDTSPDGATWTTQRTVAMPSNWTTPSIAMVTCDITSGYYGTETSPTPTYVYAFNTTKA